MIGAALKKDKESKVRSSIASNLLSIIDETLYQSKTCFQMEYVIMGFMKVPREV